MDFSVELSDKEFKLLSGVIYDKAGIKLGTHKKELLKNRLRKRLKELGIGSFKDYYRFITDEDATGGELANMLTAISTNVTFFFREDNHFSYLTDTFLPALVERKLKEGSNTIRAWSAGCSSGEEAYSIAITLSDFLRDRGRWDVKVLATDISSKVIDRAKAGVYDTKVMENVDAEKLKSHFLRGYGEMEGTVKVKKHIMEMVSVQHLNLKTRPFPFKGEFDFVFCRNVLIYFDRETQKDVLTNVGKYLTAGGHLFLGHSEGLAGRLTQFKQSAPAVYIKE